MEKTVIQGEGTLDCCCSGKCNKPDPVPIKCVNNISNGKFCPFQTVWRQVFRQHALGYVNYKNHVAPGSLDRCLLQVPGRTCKADDQQEKACEDKDCFPSSPYRIDRDKFLQNACADKLFQCLFAPMATVEKKAKEKRQGPEQVKHVNVVQFDITHGILLNQVVRSMVSRVSNIRAVKANMLNCSL